MAKKLKVTLIRSTAGRKPLHRATVVALGLRRLNQVIEVQDSPSMRGMLDQVAYLIKVEESK